MYDTLIFIAAFMIVILMTGVLPTLIHLLFGWLFTRFNRTRDLGVRFFAMSMVAPKLTARYCRRCCNDTPCRNWTCENYHHSNIENK